MIGLQWETTASLERDAASPAGDVVSPEGDLLASPNFGICDTIPNKTITVCFILTIISRLSYSKWTFVSSKFSITNNPTIRLSAKRASQYCDGDHELKSTLTSSLN